MGSFIGHITPGTLFFLSGIWSAYKLLLRYFLSRKQTALRGSGKDVPAVRFRTSLAYPFSCCPAFPTEEVMALVAPLGGAIGELLTGFSPDRSFELGNGQHMAMYLMFGVAAVVLLLRRYRYPVPPDADYLCFALAFGLECLVFYYHLHGRPHMDVQLHMFLVYAAAMCCVAILCEMKYRHNPLAGLARSYFVALQGSWFFQVGFILYPPFGNTWDPHDHHQMMLVTMIYVWHFAGHILVILILGCMALRQVRIMTSQEVYRVLGEAECEGLEKTVGVGGVNQAATAYMMVPSEEEDELEV